MASLTHHPLCLSSCSLMALTSSYQSQHKSQQTLFQTVNAELIQITKWFAASKLSLNLEKTVFISFTSHRKICPLQTAPPPYCINGTPISQVTSTEFLGVFAGNMECKPIHNKYFYKNCNKCWPSTSYTLHAPHPSV